MIKDTSAQDVVISPKSNKMKAAIVVAAIALIIAFAANAFIFDSKASRSFDRSSVQIATVELGDLIRDVSANGRIVAANAPQVYSPEQGFVELKVSAGDSVQVGQVIAVVESPELTNELQQQRSEMDRLEGELSRQELDSRSQALQLTKQLDIAQVDLEAAQRENRRAQASIQNNLISQIDFEKAVDDLARAKLTQKHAKEEVAIAKDRLQFELDSARSRLARQSLVVAELERKIAQLNIEASVNGVVGNLLVQTKALVAKNDALMTLVDLSAYEVELNVAESYANDIAIGMPVEIKVAGKTVMGTLSAISPEVESRQVKTRVRFDEDSVEGIRQNQQVSSRILLDNKLQVVKVRRGSFMQSGGFVAYKVEGDIATRIDISIGASSMREVEILSGLQANDQIIISNYDEFNGIEHLRLN
jgi:HlyD family secretion protein